MRPTSRTAASFPSAITSPRNPMTLSIPVMCQGNGRAMSSPPPSSFWLCDTPRAAAGWRRLPTRRFLAHPVNESHVPLCIPHLQGSFRVLYVPQGLQALPLRRGRLWSELRGASPRSASSHLSAVPHSDGERWSRFQSPPQNRPQTVAQGSALIRGRRSIFRLWLRRRPTPSTPPRRALIHCPALPTLPESTRIQTPFPMRPETRIL